MSETSETPTPETEALINSFPEERGLAELADSYNKLLAHARKLERERDALLKAIYDAKLKLALNSSPEGISAAYEILRLAPIEAKDRP